MKKTDPLSAKIDFLTVPEALAFRARHQPKQIAFTFLQGKERISITYEQLFHRVSRLAGFLIENGMQGKRAILLYPPGFDFIIGFFACLCVGVVAVPASPPATERLLNRIADIIKDADASMILTNREMLAHLKKLKTLHQLMAFPVANHLGKILLKKAGFTTTFDNGDIPMVALDTLVAENSEVLDAEELSLKDISGDSIAFLQYTSGSTGSPKGVMVTHRNILHNSGLNQAANRISSGGVGLNWLPMYHDMGIITGIMHPVHIGFICHLMSPLDFIQDPLSWLRNISENQVTHSGGPNFAYALCVNRFDPQYLKGVDLSSWQVAFTGAEPICPETMRQFTQTFGPYGFRAESLMPAYGLAESTVGVCWSKYGQGAVFKEVDAEFLRHDIVAPPRSLSTTRQLISSGRIDGGLEISIVDPVERGILSEDQIGEIWVAGDSVAAGYWNKPSVSCEVFEAKVVDSPQAWLRTGDLGFISDGELYVTGRMKDLIIIRGKNHYPQDIESSVQNIHSSIRQGTVIAFSVEISGEESLVLVLEIRSESAAEYDEIIKSVRQTVSAEHQLVPYAIVLLAPQGIPKTSSGKLQRKRCKSLFENNDLHPVRIWTH